VYCQRQKESDRGKGWHVGGRPAKGWPSLRREGVPKKYVHNSGRTDKKRDRRLYKNKNSRLFDSGIQRIDDDVYVIVFMSIAAGHWYFGIGLLLVSFGHWTIVPDDPRFAELLHAEKKGAQIGPAFLLSFDLSNASVGTAWRQKNVGRPNRTYRWKTRAVKLAKMWTSLLAELRSNSNGTSV
jgi:hypothetical protein